MVKEMFISLIMQTPDSVPLANGLIIYRIPLSDFLRCIAYRPIKLLTHRAAFGRCRPVIAAVCSRSAAFAGCAGLGTAFTVCTVFHRNGRAFRLHSVRYSETFRRNRVAMRTIAEIVKVFLEFPGFLPSFIYKLRPLQNPPKIP